MQVANRTGGPNLSLSDIYGPQKRSFDTTDTPCVHVADDQELIEGISSALAQAKKQQHDREQIAEITTRLATLTPRETQVFHCIATGQANKVVAIDLNISERTVEVHRSQVMKKMQVRSLAQLVSAYVLIERENQSHTNSPQ